jgi:hypothetical protein
VARPAVGSRECGRAGFHGVGEWESERPIVNGYGGEINYMFMVVGAKTGEVNGG